MLLRNFEHVFSSVVRRGGTCIAIEIVKEIQLKILCITPSALRKRSYPSKAKRQVHLVTVYLYKDIL